MHLKLKIVKLGHQDIGHSIPMHQAWGTVHQSGQMVWHLSHRLIKDNPMSQEQHSIVYISNRTHRKMFKINVLSLRYDVITEKL